VPRSPLHHHHGWHPRCGTLDIGRDGEPPRGLTIRSHGLFLQTERIMRHPVRDEISSVCFLALLLSSTTLFAVGLPTADQGRGEWTLVVIPDTQGYVEPWPEEGFRWPEVRDTFEWLPTVSDQLNIRVVQSVGDRGEFYHGCHPSQSLNLMHIMGATHTK